MEEKNSPNFCDEGFKKDLIIFQKEFQTIYRAQEISENGEMVIEKEYTIQTGNNNNNVKIKNLFEREVSLMKELMEKNCPNFIKYKREGISNEKSDENYYFIIREYCFSNLEEFIEMNEGKLEPGLIRLIMKQLNNSK